MHFGAKTLAHRRQMYRGAIHVLKKYYGYAPYNQIYGYCCALLDKRDGFFEPVPASVGKFLLSAAYGSWKNGRHLLRFWRECLREGIGALQRGSWPPAAK